MKNTFFKILFLHTFLFTLGATPSKQIDSKINHFNVLSRARSYNSHKEINGFYWSYGYVEPSLYQDEYGYFYYDMEVYYANFTSESRLYILHNKVDFTPGHVAHENDPSSNYKSTYYLNKMFLHTNVFQKTEDNKQSSTFYYKECSPHTDSFTSTVTTSTGLSLNISLDGEADVSDNGSVKVKGGTGFTFIYDKSIAITSNEPYLSMQHSSENYNTIQWNVEYNDKGKTTYTLDTFYIFELKNNGNAYQDYSFGFTTYIKMETIKDKGWWWAKKHTLETTYNGEYGLY